MNAVEIEEAVSDLAAQTFDAEEFPFAFLAAFGKKETEIKRLRSRSLNTSDLPDGVLLRNNIHLSTCAQGNVGETLQALRASTKTASSKAKFLLATDGVDFEAEDLTSGETVACDYADFPNHFGFFLTLAGITTVKQVRENAFDIRATSRLNRLYVELRKDNTDWDRPERRHDMNHFMARLIFCFFAESTDIFVGSGLFTATIDKMTARDASNTHEVIGTVFRAMNTRTHERAAWGCPRWADAFPYVNGGLFSGSTDAPRFSRIARSYLLHIGNLDWKKINPDIFGSMIQAVADEDERGALGMHYTSVPNILKVLNPLFLADLRARLEEAGDNARMLLNLRKRMAKIRVFDPACGSGNFLVIAYKEMRAIEAEINRLRGETDRRSEIPLTNFRGIELRDFPAEIARLALIIAEYQCDLLYRGQKEALRDFLPLDAQNWITCGNALRLDWLSICPPTGTAVKHHADDLFHMPLEQAQIDFENEGGETYVCGNPPYKGGTEQTNEQKEDMASIFNNVSKAWKSLDYVAGWFFKFTEYAGHTNAACAFVSTNSISQGEQVARLWPLIISRGYGKQRYCLWILEAQATDAAKIPWIADRLDRVRKMRLDSTKDLTRRGAATPYAFQQVRQTGDETVILVPRHSSENREYLPISLQASGAIIADAAFALFDAPLLDFAILSSRLHLTWVAAVCGKLETRYRYSSTLGWNTFPVLTLTGTNKADLTRCAEDILLAREAHFPATIADLYDPETMPDDLRAAHERNDEVLERIYIGRRFKNDTERLEKLFDLYSKMIEAQRGKAAKGKASEKAKAIS